LQDEQDDRQNHAAAQQHGQTGDEQRDDVPHTTR
jgi:hypothetical protein